MPYVPRPPTTAHCAHCNVSFEKRHASRKYCSNSCNVQASYARNGRPGDGRATRADLEQMLTEMKLLLQDRSAPTPLKPAAKAAATKAEAKERLQQAAQAALASAVKKTIALATEKAQKRKTAVKPAPAAKAAATRPKKKITKATAPAPTAKAVAKARFAGFAQKAYDEGMAAKPATPAPTANAAATKPAKKTAAQLKARADLKAKMQASLSALQQLEVRN